MWFLIKCGFLSFSANVPGTIPLIGILVRLLLTSGLATNSCCAVQNSIRAKYFYSCTFLAFIFRPAADFFCCVHRCNWSLWKLRVFIFCKVQFYADDKKWAIFGKIEFQKLAIQNKISEKMDRDTTNMNSVQITVTLINFS